MTNRQEAARAATEQRNPNERRELALATRKTELLAEVTNRLDKQAPRIEAYLAKLQQGDSERFRMAVLEAVSKTPALIECTPVSIVQAALEAAALGLEPTGILGGAYMVPYKNHGTKEAKLIVGYRGYIDLIHRAGAVKSIEARVVYEGDAFEVEFGTQKKIRHVPYFVIGNPQGERRFVYWVAEVAGETQFDVLPMTTIEKARKASRAGDDGPWVNWYDEMAKKTAIRRAVSILPISVYEARRAVMLENDAEENAEPIPESARASSGPTARARAVAMLDGGSVEDPAGQDVAGGEGAPGDETTNQSSAGDDARLGRPTGSEDPGVLTPAQEEAARASATDEDDLPG